MGDFNKLFAIIFGVIIFIVLLIFLAQRFNVFERVPILSVGTEQTKNVKATPTPTPYETIVVTNTGQAESGNESFAQGSSQSAKRRVQGVSTYPETGPETVLLIVSVTSILSGYLLRKKI